VFVVFVGKEFVLDGGECYCRMAVYVNSLSLIMLYF